MAGTPTVDPTITTRPATATSAPPPPPPMAYLMKPNPFAPLPTPPEPTAPVEWTAEDYDALNY